MTDTPTPARPALDAMAEEIERLLKDATPGPWEHRFFKHNNRTAIQAGDKVLVLRRMSSPEYEAEANDQELVCYLRNNAPALVAALRSLADMRGEMDMIGGALASIAESQIVERSVDGNHMYTGVGMSALTALATLKAALARGAP